MRKHHGYQPRTLPMHQNFTKCSTSDTQISQDHRTVNRSQNSHCITVQQNYCKFLLVFLSSTLNSFSPFLSFLIPKCSCSLPLYLLSLCCSSFLSSLSASSFILFLFYYITLLNHPPLHPWNPPLHHLHHPHDPCHFPPGCSPHPPSPFPSASTHSPLPPHAPTHPLNQCHYAHLF